MPIRVSASGGSRRRGTIRRRPTSYYANKLSDRFAFGIGVTTLFGLITDWRDRPVTFFAQTSELVTFVVNPNVAFKIGDRWSLGLGVSFVDAEIKEFSREVPVELDGNPFNGPEVVGFSNLTGSGDEIGWNVAVSRRGPGWSFGFSYRSDVTVGIEGDIAFSDFGPLAGLFRDSPGTADLDLPDLAAIGVAWGGSRGWTYEFDVTWIGWSVFDTLVIDVQNEVPGVVEDIVLHQDWDDGFAYRLGVSHRGEGPSEWRFGGDVRRRRGAHQPGAAIDSRRRPPGHHRRLRLPRPQVEPGPLLHGAVR